MFINAKRMVNESIQVNDSFVLAFLFSGLHQARNAGGLARLAVQVALVRLWQWTRGASDHNAADVSRLKLSN
jgi:hypothetical protein